MRLSTLRLRMFLLVLAAVLPGIGLLVYVERVERASADQQARDQARQLVDLATEQQQRTIDAAQGFLTALTSLPAIAALDGPSCTRALAELQPRMPLFNVMGMADHRGRVVCNWFENTPDHMIMIADRLYFRNALARGAFASGEFQYSRANGNPSINFGLPLLDGAGRPKAVLYAGLDLTAMQRRLDEVVLPPGGALAVFDHAGILLAGRPGNPGAPGRPGDDEILRLTRRAAAGVAAVGSKRKGRIWAWRTLKVGSDEAMIVTASVSPSDVAVPLKTAFGRSLAALALAALAVIVAAAVVTEKQLIRPVNALVAAARRISAGDLGTRTGVKRIGELGDLAAAFDDMARSLEVLTRQNLLILDSVGEGILGVDPGRCLTFANPLAGRLLGAEPLELRGAPIDEFLGGVERDGGANEACPIAAAMADGGVRHVSTTFVRRNGTRFPAEYVATPIHDEGRVVGAVISFRDVSDRRRLEEQLRQAQKMEALGQLAGGVAHDFNNLLTAILSFARFAKAELSDDHPSREDVDEIISAAGRASSLTRQLLAFSRRQVLEPCIFDLGQTVSDLEKMLRRLIGEDVTLETHIAPVLGKVKADPGHIEQVILNLVVNAREAMPSGGRLLIELRDVVPDDPETCGETRLPAGPLVLLSVTDTGTGMDEATLSHIYEPFFTTKIGKGTGLGLATVYGIIMQSGGAIRVRSVPGKGTTFKIFLPHAAESAVAPSPEPALPAPGTETVLLVEDDDDVRGLARRALTQAGYRVLEASRPSEALAVAQRHDGHVDLLFADVILPESSGPDLASELVASRPDLRVLYTSGYTGLNLANRGSVSFEYRFLPKPFGPEVLLRSVRAVLDAPGSAEVRDLSEARAARAAKHS